jgi:hypothetical protein
MTDLKFSFIKNSIGLIVILNLFLPNKSKKSDVVHVHTVEA